MKTPSDDEFARAFAPLMEVKQRGVIRSATAADVLELLGTGGRRYVLKGKDGYLAKNGKGWADKQRGAIEIDDPAYAREMRDMGWKEYGVRVKIVRLRRKGTCGIEAVRLRQDIDVRDEDGKLSFMVSRPEAMELLSALTGAKRGTAEQ